MGSSRAVDAELLLELASSLGLSLIGAAGHEELERLRVLDAPALDRWQEAGFAGEMGYMRRPSSLLAQPTAIEPALRSVISFAIPYLHGNPREVEPPPPGFGRVARYAWGRDYHRVLKRTLKGFIAAVTARLPSLGPITYRLFTDAVPMLERAIAAQAGVGVVGKNTMLIRPGSGSYLFLAEVLWDLEVKLPTAPRNSRSSDPCGSCSRCLTRCPTGAFVEPRVLDARRCISYLTIEKRGPFSEWEAAALGNWVFGCDVCQEVCPFNHKAVPRSTVSEFEPERGAGSLLELERLLSIPSADAFAQRFAGTAIMRAGFKNLRRNAVAVVANTTHLPAIPLLLELFTREDELLRGEVARALRRLVPHTDGAERRRILAAIASGTSAE